MFEVSDFQFFAFKYVRRNLHSQQLELVTDFGVSLRGQFLRISD